MVRHFNALKIRPIFYILILYSICQMIEVAESRFLWDLSFYCINYCSRTGVQSHPIGVCSCHRITSYHRRSSLDDFSVIPKQVLDNYTDGE